MRQSAAWQFTNQIYVAVGVWLFFFFFFENWCINVFTMVIIHTDFEEKKAERTKRGESNSLMSLEGNAV